eukprot:GILI01048203.1.p1 GENE.GILI01048203.1~~GILI01048203.1.p1  ORF type:complete len:103 (+),score=19.76 GILI01048203.1:69-377(+)
MSLGAASSSQQIIQLLEPMKGKRVSVGLTDGRHLLGILGGYDTFTNIVLSGITEHSYTVEEAPAGTISRTHEAVPTGTLMIRGATVVSIGLVDTFAEAEGDV